MEPIGWQDTERGHTGMAGVGTEVGGRRERGREGGEGRSREAVAVRGFMEVRREIQQTGAQVERTEKVKREEEVGRIDGWNR